MEAKGKVNSVRLSSDGPVLNIAGVGDVPFYEITEFSEASTSRLKQVGEKNLLKPLRETAQAISNELGFTVRDDLGAIT